MRHDTTMYCHDPNCTMFDQAQSFWYYPATYEFPPEGQDLECNNCYGEVHEYMTPIAEIADDAADWLPTDSLEWDGDDRLFFVRVHAYVRHKQEQYRLKLTERSPA